MCGKYSAAKLVVCIVWALSHGRQGVLDTNLIAVVSEPFKWAFFC